MTHPLARFCPSPSPRACACPDVKLAGPSEADVAKGSGTAIGVAAAACSVVPGIGTGLCAAGAAIASAFVALGVALSAGLRCTYHPDAELCAAQLANFEVLPSALWAGYDTLTVEGFHTGDPFHPRTGTAAHDACRLVRYDLLIAHLRLSGSDPIYNPMDRSSKSNHYLESAVPDPAWPLTDYDVTRKILAQVLAHGGDCNSQAVQPLPKTKSEAHAVLVVLRSQHYRDSGILGWDPTKNVLPGLRRNAGRLMRIVGETGVDPVLSALLGGPVGPGLGETDVKVRGLDVKSYSPDPALGASPADRTAQPCPPAPSRAGWFALGAAAAVAALAAIAVSANPRARAHQLADALDSYSRSPSANALDAVERAARRFEEAARKLSSSEGHEAADFAMRQSSALRQSTSSDRARRMAEAWAIAWRAWREF